MITYEDLSSALQSVHQYDNYFSASCPFHDDARPSMLVYKDGWWRCLECGRNGRWNSLWAKIKGQPMPVRPEIRTQWAGPNFAKLDAEEIAYQANEDLVKYPSLGWYLEMRGVDSLIDTCYLGYWEGWYTVPVYDHHGKFITTYFRAAPHVQAVSGMRHFYKGHNALFSPNWNRVSNGKTLFVVFGMFDALTLGVLGFPVITPVSGDWTFKPEVLEDLRKKIVLIPDRDAEAKIGSYTSRLGWRGHLLLLDYTDKMKDPNDLYVGGRKDYLVRMLNSQ